MATVTYNGVHLPYPFFTQFDQESAFDESNTDRWGTRFMIGVQAVINFNYINAIAPAVAARVSFQDAGTIMNYIRELLLQPRRLLQIACNDKQILPAVQTGLPANAYVDALNGPTPKYCRVDQLTNTSFNVVWGCEAHYCVSGFDKNLPNEATGIIENDTGNNVLYNRWEESVAIDKCQFSRRTRNGLYCIRSDNVGGKIADEMRVQMAVLGVPPGFLRENSNYTVQPDGLRVRYSVVDQEQFKMPPDGAYEASGVYRETTTMGGAKRFGSVQLTLKGSKTTDQEMLVALAVSIASRKLRQNGVAGRSQLMTRCAVEVDMYKNVVTCNAEAMMKPRMNGDVKARKADAAGLFMNGMVDTPMSPPGGMTPPTYNARGTANLLLQAAAYWDPSIKNNQLSLAGQFERGIPVGQLGKKGG